MRAAALLLLGGCTALFGISHVDTPPIDGGPDGAPRTVQCDYLWHVVPAAGEVVSMAAPPGYAHVSVGDQDLPIGGDGSFQFSSPEGQPWDLLWTTTNAQHILRDTETCHLVTAFYERLGGAVPTKSTPVGVTLSTGAPAGGTSRLASTGIRAYANPAASAGMFSIDWHSVTDVALAPAALLSGADGDLLYYLHYATPTGYIGIDQAASAAVTMVDGQPTPVTVTPMPVTPRCTQLITNAGMLISTLTANDARGAGSPSSGWSIDSLPATDEGPGGGIALASATSSTPTDQTLSVTYGNPFPGETDMLEAGAAIGHSLAIGGATPWVFSSGYQVILPPALNGPCTAATSIPVPPVAMATTTTVAGHVLSSEEQPVMIDRSAPVPVAIGLAAGPWDEMIVGFDEISAQNGATVPTQIGIYLPADTSFTIDPSLLLVGHEYLLIIYARTGQPLARSGDFRAYQYPVAQSATVSFSFRVAN